MGGAPSSVAPRKHHTGFGRSSSDFRQRAGTNTSMGHEMNPLSGEDPIDPSQHVRGLLQVNNTFSRIPDLLTSLGSFDAEFEGDRVAQLKLWKTHREFFAASRNLLSVLVKFEEQQRSAGLNHGREFYLQNRDTFGATVLHVAILTDSREVAEYLIEKYSDRPEPGRPAEMNHGSLINSRYHLPKGSLFEGESSLHLSIVKGQFDLIRKLVQNGADVNALVTGKFFDQRTSDDNGVYLGGTALAFAVCTGQQHIVEYLLDSGAHIRSQDVYGNTALHMAVWYERMDIYDLLVARDEVSLDAIDELPNLEHMTNKANLTPLKLAVDRGSIAMFKHILSRHREVGWSFGPLTEFLYPIDELDTFNPGSALEIAVLRGTLTHAKLLDIPPMKELLSEKWQEFARFFFISIFIMYLCVSVGMTVIATQLPEDLDDYDTEHGTARLWGEVVIFLLILLDTLLLELPDILQALSPDSGYAALLANSFVFVIVSWGMRVCAVTTFSLRLSRASGELQRSFLAFTLVLTWLYTLNLARGFKIVGRFLKFIEQIAFELIKWSVVYVFTLFGFATAFFVIMRHPGNTLPEDEDGFSSFGVTLFTLLKFTIGEVDFSEYTSSVSTWAAMLLFVGFILIVSVILFNLLIAVMAALHDNLQQTAHDYAALSWAASVIIIERRLYLRRWREKFRSGLPGSSCGIATNPNGYYKAVIMRDAGTFAGIEWAQQDRGGFRRPRLAVPTRSQDRVFESFFVSQAAQNPAILKPYAVLQSVMQQYDPSHERVVSRDSMTFLLEDFYSLGNIAVPPTQVLDSLAKALDGPDMDNQVAIETINTFVRLWRSWIRQDQSKRTALIIVDVQNDFVDGPVHVRGANVVVQKVNKIRKLVEEAKSPFDLVVVTQDWHPQNHSCFRDDMEEQSPWSWRKQMPVHCVQGTPGAELHPKLKMLPTDVIIKKGSRPESRSYSAFWNDDRVHVTKLFEVLFDHDIDEVYVCGSQYDGAVARTAKDARIFGWPTTVLLEATAWTDEAHRRETDLQLTNLEVDYKLPLAKLVEDKEAPRDNAVKLSNLRKIKRLKGRLSQSLKLQLELEELDEHAGTAPASQASKQPFQLQSVPEGAPVGASAAAGYDEVEPVTLETSVDSA
eukprot:m.69963 g.69963  ORF g.69963 m.69963 type:complete len:1130 (-) comp14027_c0_seq1:297-3686(-)